jgi:type I restriction enzyme S subunit
MDNNIQINSCIEEIAKNIFNEWFVNFNYPNAKADKKNSFLGEIPASWDISTLSQLGKVVTGNTPSSNNPHHFEGEMPFVTPSDFKNYQKLIISAERTLSVDGALNLKNRVLPPNSVIVTCIGSNMGKVAINKVKCVTNQQINSIVVPYYLSEYLYNYLLNSYDLLRGMASGGSTMPIINKSQFEGINIVVPEIELLEKFQGIVTAMNETIESNLRQNEVLREIRDNLLPKLLSGQFPLNISSN